MFADIGFGCFSVVAYLPKPLAGLIEPLRAQLVPGCRARAHLSVLSPRPLCRPAGRVRGELEEALQDIPSFAVRLGEVSVFQASEVIFLSVEEGTGELTALHRRANHGGAAFADEYSFHPHVTLAQDLRWNGKSARRQAVEVWARYDGPRQFWVDTVHLVECTAQGSYIDVAEIALRSQVAV